jgi:UDP-2,3-diacylglucosamine pyrophosphatase LpxH
LREEVFLERLAPALEGIDELIFLGDLFDFLFGSVGEAVDAADGLLRLIAERLPGKRLVFLAGNHDHHLVHRDAENRIEALLASGLSPGGEGEGAPSAEDERAGPGFFRSFLARRLPGVEVEIAYPEYEFGGVLCTHGHYLDPHARLAGSRGSRLLTRTLWGIAAGGPEQPQTVEDYESVITLLTEWLYAAAQMPHGTHAQQNVFRATQRAAKVESALRRPLHALRRLRGERAPPEPPPRHSAYPAASVVSPSDPSEHALEAFAQVVANLGWAARSDRIVFAHTHQPLACVRSSGDARTRYWNTGSWIYEPPQGSPQAHERYLRYAWPGTAVVIDDEAPEPQLIELLADLNPLNDGPGLPSSGS